MTLASIAMSGLHCDCGDAGSSNATILASKKPDTPQPPSGHKQMVMMGWTLKVALNWLPDGNVESAKFSPPDLRTDCAIM